MIICTCVMTEHSLLQAWRSCPIDSPPYLLPADVELIGKKCRCRCDLDLAAYVASDGFGDPEDKSLQLGLLPQPFVGNSAKASIVVLMLNPGFHPGDFAEVSSAPLREALVQNLHGQALHCPFLDPTFAAHPGFDYWHGRLRGVVRQLGDRFGWRYQYTLQRFAAEFASLELFPYHSAKFGVNDAVLARLASVTLMKSFVHEVLVPRTNKRERRCWWSLAAQETGASRPPTT